MTYIPRREAMSDGNAYICGAGVGGFNCPDPLPPFQFHLCGRYNLDCNCLSGLGELPVLPFLPLACSIGYKIRVTAPSFFMASDVGGPGTGIGGGTVNGTLFTHRIIQGSPSQQHIKFPDYHCIWSNCVPASNNPGGNFIENAGPCSNYTNSAYELGYLGSYTVNAPIHLTSIFGYAVNDYITKIGVFGNIKILSTLSGRVTQIRIFLAPYFESYEGHSFMELGSGSAGHAWQFRGFSRSESGCGCAVVCEEIICPPIPTSPASGWFISGGHHAVSNCVSNPGGYVDYISTYFLQDPGSVVGDASAIITGLSNENECLCSDGDGVDVCCRNNEPVPI